MIREGYIYMRHHPSEPLVIYDYTSRTQYGNHWNPTTMACRGLICAEDGTVVARPFAKFFNVNEIKEVPPGPYEIQEKLDGSLGILYWVDGLPYIATRGSFVSVQAIWATKWLHDFLDETGAMLSSNLTYLFEILHPDNKIVVDYGKREELVLLAVIDTRTGEELDIEGWGFPTVNRHPAAPSFDNLINLDIKNFEGFVVKCADGTRIKVKLAEYKRLHRIMTMPSERFILDALLDGDDISLAIEGVPDEFHGWVDTVVNRFQAEYKAIEKEARTILDTVTTELYIRRSLGDRKSWATAFTKTNYADILFAMLDDKSYRKMIWKRIDASGAPQETTPWSIRSKARSMSGELNVLPA